jgi:hypothetical protein
MMQLPTSSSSSSSSSRRRRRRRPVPIDERCEERTARAGQERNHEAIMADYVDLCFATRLVNGMQKKQSFTLDVSLRYANQALIDHIIATRENREGQQELLLFGPQQRTNSVTRRPPRSNSNDKLKQRQTIIPSRTRTTRASGL